jgi:hypothetical protein
MMEVHDELIERAAEAMRRRQSPNPQLVSRILSAVDGRPHHWWRNVEWPSARFSLAAGTLAAAGLLLGFLTSEATDRGGRRAADAETLIPASRNANAPRPVPVQFTLRDVRASQVALVGDFNGWAQDATLLERGAEAGTWTVTVPLSLGRHVYAFVVDGRTWMTDPRAQTTRDLDFGRANSVLIVQAP